MPTGMTRIGSGIHTACVMRLICTPRPAAWHIQTPIRRFATSQNGYSQYSSRYGSFDNASAMAAGQASTAGLPASLVERVIRRESGGNPRAVHAGNYGLMQIRLSTARAMGYTGSAAGLLDPQTNMTYALRYLAGAYRAAGGNESRAIALYSAAIITRRRRKDSRPTPPTRRRCRLGVTEIIVLQSNLGLRLHSKTASGLARGIAGIITHSVSVIPSCQRQGGDPHPPPQGGG